MNTYERVSFLREAANVRRSHTLRQLQPYTLAQHSFGLLLILSAIYEKIDASMPYAIVRAAMYHDLSEKFTGDMPATAKWHDEGLKNELSRVSTAYEIENDLRGYLPSSHARLLSWCDLFEFACNQMEELRLGNTYARAYVQTSIDNLQSRGLPEGVYTAPCLELINNLTLEFAKYDKSL